MQETSCPPKSQLKIASLTSGLNGRNVYLERKINVIFQNIVNAIFTRKEKIFLHPEYVSALKNPKMFEKP